jgi:hypothetical protein
MDTSVLTKKEFERPDAKTRNKELKLADQLFKLSDQQGTLQDYESFKNNPIIVNKIKQSNLAFEDTSKKKGTAHRIIGKQKIFWRCGWV